METIRVRNFLPLAAAWATLFTVSLTACAPLQQAPLVYSSKLVVGLDVSTSTTENPGFSFSAGVKTVDAAYVPVAVSKANDERSTAERTVEIQPILAKFGQGNSDRKPDIETENNKAKILSYLQAQQDAKESKEAVLKSQTELTAALALQELVTGAARVVKDAQKLPDQPSQVDRPKRSG